MTVEPSGAVELLLSSLRMYSPTSQESGFAGFLADQLRGLGYSRVRADGAGNVLGETGHGKRSLLLCGHMDTVPGDLPVRRTRGRIFGRGASDAKSPLCALLLAGAEANDSDVRVTFAGVTQEEGDGRGVEELMRGEAQYDYAVFGEPGSARRVTIGYRGRTSVNLVVKAKGGHAGSPWAGQSAFDGFSAILERIRTYERSRTVAGDHFHSVSVTPTIIRAGSFHNIVPSNCEATLDVRVPPGLRVGDVLKQIRLAARSPVEGTKVSVSSGEPTEAYQADPNSTLVRAFQRAILLRLGGKPTLVRKTGTGDMNTFAHGSRAVCLTYGPGDSRTSHTDGEMVEVRDYLDSIKVIREAIRQLGSLSVGGTP